VEIFIKHHTKFNVCDVLKKISKIEEKITKKCCVLYLSYVFLKKNIEGVLGVFWKGETVRDIFFQKV
jgi:hypothetical protein